MLALLKRHGWNATSFQVLAPGFRYWFDEGEGASADRADDACVAYVEAGRAWVVAGSPIAPEARLAEVTARFAARARAAGRRVCFFATESRFVETAGLSATLVGEQPVWDPAEWEGTTLRGSRSLREQLRRARAKGVTVREVTAEEVADPDAPVRRAIERLVARWLASRAMAPMGFLVDVQPFHFAAERRYVVAEREGAVIGFVAAVPVYARGGWFFEDLVRDPGAPNGTAELLVDAAMRRAARDGSRYVTLGLAPLSGPVRGWLGVLRAWSAALYDFGGLRAFKARLRPAAWAPIYLCHARSTPFALALYDALAAFARGSFVRFGLATVLRGPAVVVRALAAALVPWTVMLALADNRRWFPAPWVQHAWVLFDLALAVALLVLAAGRRRRWLGLAVASAVSLDALLTLAEAVAYNAPRARGVLDWVVIVVSCAAPALAAPILWGAVRARHVAAA